MERIKIGISSCLLGNEVRYDGAHQLDRFLRDTLGQYVSYVPVCPEVECGLPVPREPMRLEGDPRFPRLVTSRTRKDLTEQMTGWAERRILELEAEGLCGFVFKKDSPSSGMARVKVYGPDGMPQKNGVGLFALLFMHAFPLVPVEEDGRLHDPALRENFVERIFVFKRWRAILGKQPSVRDLVEFHTRHKLLVLSHSPRLSGEMGKLVARAKEFPAEELTSKYQELLMEALKLKTSAKKNTNVLQHMMGYFKKRLSADEKQELLEVIGAYHDGHVPLIVPVTLINHYVRKYEEPYLRDQMYLHPHPIELQLRNHV